MASESKNKMVNTNYLSHILRVFVDLNPMCCVLYTNSSETVDHPFFTLWL